ncbi:MAG TPA: toxin-antitoxin system HicB family antitoxin [Caulobacteraceae bacterium]|nr:toxin-antitoxin system HicB family antitoxin [Caulobacteraceae bacterium]
MDTTRLVETLRHDLCRAAELGGEDVWSAAERLLNVLEPSMRLVLMEALSQAAAEISEAAPGMTVEVRLVGREPAFLLAGAPATPAAEPAFEPEDGESTARITLRLPEALKARAEVLAARRGQSLNTWLVAAARAAAAAADGPPPSEPHRHGMPGRRVQGWAR